MIPPPAQQNRTEVTNLKGQPFQGDSDPISKEIGSLSPKSTVPLIGVEPKAYRAVIHETHLHIGAKLTGFNRFEPCLAECDEAVEI